MSPNPMMALVVQADDPLDNRIMRGDRHSGLVRILVRDPEPVLLSGRFKLDREHWLVPGMELPVTLDTAGPGSFEVRWDEVPTMEDRAASNPPELADPLGTRKRIVDALTAAGVAPALGAYPGDPKLSVLAALVTDIRMGDGSQTLAGFKRSLDDAAGKEALGGRVRAVALIAATEATLRQDTSSDEGGEYRDRHGKKAAVLAVNVPGRDPYAVFVAKFDHRKGKGSVPGRGLPASVAPGDPHDVEVLWDEMLSVKDQAKATAAAAMQSVHERLATSTQAAAAAPAGGMAPGASGAAQVPSLPPEMKAMIAATAKQALAGTKDPAMRQMLITQYRAAGVEIDEEAERG